MHKYTHTAFNSTFYLPKYFCTISILGVLEKARIWLFFKIVSQIFWNWSNFEEHTLVYLIIWHLLGIWYRKGKWTADHVNGGAEGNLEHQPQQAIKIKINAWLFIFFRKKKIYIYRKEESFLRWGITQFLKLPGLGRRVRVLLAEAMPLLTRMQTYCLWMGRAKQGTGKHSTNPKKKKKRREWIRPRVS